MATLEKEVVPEKVGDCEPLPPKSNVETIEFKLSSSATLGISIKGGIDHPYLVSKEKKAMDVGIFVIHIYAGGVAAADGRLRLGDRILAVNGVNVERVMQMQFLKILSSAASAAAGAEGGEGLKLTVKHNETLRKRLDSRKMTVPTMPAKPVSNPGAATKAPLNGVQLLTGDHAPHFEALEVCANPDFLANVVATKPNVAKEDQAAVPPYNESHSTSAPHRECGDDALLQMEKASQEQTEKSVRAEEQAVKEKVIEEEAIKKMEDAEITALPSSAGKNWRGVYLPISLITATALGFFLVRRRART